MELKVIKTDNIIEDICIANGLCSILEYNEIEYILRNKKSMISIEVEEFDIEELIFSPLTIEETYNINTSMSMSNNQGQLDELNPFIENNLENIFNYYNTLNSEFINKEMAKNTPSIGVGNCYHTLSIRASYDKKTYKTTNMIRHLSYLGWLKSCSYVKNKSIEISTLLIPKETNRIYKVFEFSYKDKETGEIKPLTSIKTDTDIELLAKQYLNTLINYNFVKEKYDYIYVMQLTLAGNKPLSDKNFELKIVDWDSSLLQDFLNKLNYSIYDIDTKDITSRFICDIKYENFSKLMKVYSKKDVGIDKKFKEELLKMYSEKIKNIYNDKNIQKLGQGLNRLLYNKRGFEIQTQLYGVANEIHIQKCISKIIDEYDRVFNYPLLNQNELQEVINIINDKKDAKICADALLANAKVFRNYKKKENENINKENNTNMEEI